MCYILNLLRHIIFISWREQIFGLFKNKIKKRFWGKCELNVFHLHKQNKIYIFFCCSWLCCRAHRVMECMGQISNFIFAAHYTPPIACIVCAVSAYIKIHHCNIHHNWTCNFFVLSKIEQKKRTHVIISSNLKFSHNPMRSMMDDGPTIYLCAPKFIYLLKSPLSHSHMVFL